MHRASEAAGVLRACPRRSVALPQAVGVASLAACLGAGPAWHWPEVAGPASTACHQIAEALTRAHGACHRRPRLLRTAYVLH